MKRRTRHSHAETVQPQAMQINQTANANARSKRELNNPNPIQSTSKVTRISATTKPSTLWNHAFSNDNSNNLIEASVNYYMNVIQSTIQPRKPNNTPFEWSDWTNTDYKNSPLIKDAYQSRFDSMFTDPNDTKTLRSFVCTQGGDIKLFLNKNLSDWVNQLYGNIETSRGEDPTTLTVDTSYYVTTKKESLSDLTAANKQSLTPLGRDSSKSHIFFKPTAAPAQLGAITTQRKTELQIIIKDLKKDSRHATLTNKSLLMQSIRQHTTDSNEMKYVAEHLYAGEYTYMVQPVPSASDYKNTLIPLYLNSFQNGRQVFDTPESYGKMDISMGFAFFATIVGFMVDRCNSSPVQNGELWRDTLKAYLQNLDSYMHDLYKPPPKSVVPYNANWATRNASNNTSLTNTNTSIDKYNTTSASPKSSSQVIMSVLRHVRENQTQFPPLFNSRNRTAVRVSPDCHHCGCLIADKIKNVDMGHIHAHSKVCDMFYAQCVELLNAVDTEFYRTSPNPRMFRATLKHLACFGYMLGMKVSNVGDNIRLECMSCNQHHGANDIDNFYHFHRLFSEDYNLNDLQPTDVMFYKQYNKESTQTLTDQTLRLHNGIARQTSKTTSAQWNRLNAMLQRDNTYIREHVYPAFFESGTNKQVRCERCFKSVMIGAGRQPGNWAYRMRLHHISRNNEETHNFYNWHSHLWLCSGCYTRAQSVPSNSRVNNRTTEYKEMKLGEFLRLNIMNTPPANLDTTIPDGYKLLIQMKILINFLISIRKNPTVTNHRTINQHITDLVQFLYYVQGLTTNPFNATQPPPSTSPSSSSAPSLQPTPQANHPKKRSKFVVGAGKILLNRIVASLNSLNLAIPPSYTYDMNVGTTTKNKMYNLWNTTLTTNLKKGGRISLSDTTSPSYSPNHEAINNISRTALGNKTVSLTNTAYRNREGTSSVWKTERELQERTQLAEYGETQQAVRTAQIQLQKYKQELTAINKALKLFYTAKNPKQNTPQYVEKHKARLGVLMGHTHDQPIRNKATRIVEKYKLGNEVQPDDSASVTTNGEDSQPMSQVTAKSPSMSGSNSEDRPATPISNIGSSQLSNTTPEVNVNANRARLNTYLTEISTLNNQNSRTKEELRTTLQTMYGIYSATQNANNQGIKNNLKHMLVTPQGVPSRKFKVRAQELVGKRPGATRPLQPIMEE